METISRREARRLALARAGLLNQGWTGLGASGAGRGVRARRAALAVLRRFGYLQLDTIPVAGARSHVIVLLSRIEGLAPELGEALLAPGEPVFEYWGHEACWIPMELYPHFEFRRREFRHHPWWGDVLGKHPDVAEHVLHRIRTEGPLRSADLEGNSPGTDNWYPKTTKAVAASFWCRGDLAIRERRNFHRVWDLAERVIPEEARDGPRELGESLRVLLLRALAGHGWAATGTLAATWRLKNLRDEVGGALTELHENGQILSCALEGPGGQRVSGWIRPADLDLARRLRRVRPSRDRGVLLSPFDPVLWDRARVQRLFGFHQVLEIYKPREQRIYGYYCLPVLAGDRLVARVDLKADRSAGKLRVLFLHYEHDSPPAVDRAATTSALQRYASALDLTPESG